MINFSNFKVVQLHDIYSEEIIGSVIIRTTEYNELCLLWDKYQLEFNSNLENEANIYEFIEWYDDNYSGTINILEVIDIDFYQA